MDYRWAAATDIDILTHFRQMIADDERALARAKKRHGFALVRQLLLANERTAEHVKSTAMELEAAKMSLVQIETAIDGLEHYKKFFNVLRGDRDSDLVDLFE